MEKETKDDLNREQHELKIIENEYSSGEPGNYMNEIQ